MAEPRYFRQEPAARENVYLVRIDTGNGEVTVIQKASKDDEAIRKVNLLPSWELIECVRAFVIKVLRPKITATKEPKLLVYSEDFQIAPSMISVDTELGRALGDRIQGRFVCTVDNGNFRICREFDINSTN